MIRVKKYFPVNSQIFYTPLIKENLRLEFASSEYKLNDLSLLIILMLRDGKNINDMVEVTLLSEYVIKDAIEVLKNQGMIDEQNENKLPEHTQRILMLSECINEFNITPPPIFSDMLTKSPVYIPTSVELRKTFNTESGAAVVKNCGQIETVEFEELENFVKKFLSEHGAINFIDELKVLRLDYSAEIFFVARKLCFLPIIGESDLSAVNLDSERTIKAELPVRKFKSACGKEFYVDLLLGTIFEFFDMNDDTEEIMLSFKTNSQLQGEKLNQKIFSQFGEVFDEGVHFIKILISEEVAGDFLCV